MEVTIVTFAYSSCMAFYIEDKLIKFGDYYHDKISDWIAGFLACLSYQHIQIHRHNVGIGGGQLHYEVTELGHDVPASLEMLLRLKDK